MDPDRLHTLSRRLHGRLPLVGGWLRRQAARELLADGSPEAVRPLARALLADPGPPFDEFLREGLRSVGDPAARLALCSLWAETRHPALAGLVRAWGWVPDSPGRTRVLCALVLRRARDVSGWTPREVEHLLQACADPDPAVAVAGRSAVEELRDPHALAALAEALTRPENTTARPFGLAVLGRLTDPEAVDSVCAAWAATRHPALAELVRHNGWVASGPPPVRVLSALLAGADEQVRSLGPEGVDALLDACTDPDLDLAAEARSTLRALRDPASREAVCQAFLRRDHPEARAAALAAGYSPRAPGDRALFLFLTEQWDAYEALDFDGSLLRAAFDPADEPLRGRVRAAARRDGRVELLGLLTDGRRLGSLTEGDWDSVQEVLRRGARWPEAWRLARVAPPRHGRNLLRLLGASGWAPPDPHERGEFADLVRFADSCPAGGPPVSCRARLRGQDEVCRLAFSPGGKLLAIAGWEGKVRLWSSPAGGPLAALPCGASALAFSPEGGALATAGAGEPVRVWRVPGGALLASLPPDSCGAFRLALGPEGRVLAGAEVGRPPRLWSVPEARQLRTLAGHPDGVWAFALSPDGQTLASAGREGAVRLWRFGDGEPLGALEGHDGAVRCLAFAPDGKTLFSGGEDGTVRRWFLAGLHEQMCLESRAGVFQLALTADGKVLAAGGQDGAVRVWHLPEGRLLNTLSGPGGAVAGLCLGGEARLLAASGQGGVVRLWDLHDDRELLALPGSGDNPFAPVALSPDGLTLATASGGAVTLWGLEVAWLASLAAERARVEHLEMAREMLREERWSAEERGWLHFLLALMWWRHRLDVGLDPGPVHAAGPDDIMLEE